MTQVNVTTQKNTVTVSSTGDITTVTATTAGPKGATGDIAALATTDGNFIVGNGSSFTVESGSTARTSLGLGTIATQAANNVSITGGTLSGVTIDCGTF